MKTSVIRAAALSCVLLATTSLVTPAKAQNLPPYRAIDANGVDLTHGNFMMSLVEGRIGSGPSELSLVRDGAWYSGFNGHRWDGILLNEWSTQRSVAMDRRAEYFTGSTSQQANGSTLAWNGTNYVHQRADGTTTVFSKANPSCTPGSSTSCLWVPTQITSPDGRAITLTWDEWQICPDVPIGEEIVCTVDSIRLGSVSNSQGYSIVFTHASGGSGSGSGTSTVGPSWFQRTRADFYNSVAGSSSQANVTYAYPSTGVMEVTDMGGRVWRIAGSEYQITGIRRPGASSDTTTISLSTGQVTSVTRDGVTTGYSRSVSGSTATMTVTDANSDQTVIVSDLTIGRPTSITDPLSRTTSYQYDSAGRLTRVTAPLGNYVAYTYDSRGNITETRRVAWSGSGDVDIVATASFDSTCSNPVTCNRPNSVTDARGNATSFTYDSTHGGVLTETQPAVGGVSPQTRYSYTLSNGEYLLTGISACASGTSSSCVGTSDESRTVVQYDSNGNVTSVERRDGTGSLSATTSATYTALGDVETIDGPLSGTADTTRTRYNAARQVVGVVSPDPDGGSSLPHRAIRTTYTNGLPTSVERGTVASQSDTDWASFSSSEAVETSYDANARPVVQRLVSGSTTYALTQTSYDAVGRVQCVAQRMNSSEFAPSSLPSDACTLDTQGSHGPDRITRTSRDAAGQVYLVQTGYGTSEVASEATMSYTTNGQLNTLTDAEGHRTTYYMDGHDRLSQTRYPDPTTLNSSNASDYEELIYETHSSGTRSTDLVASRRLRDGTSIAYSYDALSRLASKDLPGSEPTITLGYDLLGRMTSATDGSHSLSFTYDALGRNLTQVSPLGTTSYQYDAAGRRTRLTYPGSGLYVDYDYLVTGDVTAIRENGATSGAGVLGTYAYDNLGRRSSITRGNGTTTSYSYDAVSRLSQLVHDLASSNHDLTLGFTRNPASQIASTTRSNDTFAWTNHFAVNRNYTANGLNQYTASGSITPSYDTRGNLTSAGSTTYTYSSENRLLTASGSVSLAYDPLLRLYQTAGGSTTRFAYDGPAMIAEYDGSSSLLRRYVHGSGVDEPLVWYEGAGTSDRRWLHADGHGSIIAVSDGSGAATTTNTYDEFGIPGSGNSGRFQYTGQAWVPELGMYYYRARIYSPTLGRFMQIDPIGYGDGMNLYAYVGSDPVNLTDPSGLCTGSRICPSGSYFGGGRVGFSTGGVGGRVFDNAPIESGSDGGGGPSGSSRYRPGQSYQCIANCDGADARYDDAGNEIEITVGAPVWGWVNDPYAPTGEVRWYFNGERFAQDPFYQPSPLEGYAEACVVLCGPVIAAAAMALPAAIRVIPYTRQDLIRFGPTPVSNQLIYGQGAFYATVTNAIKGGGNNMPFHYHIHQYNWYNPIMWFRQTPIIRP